MKFKMKKTLGKTIAKMLYNLLRQHFDDIELISKIKETRDFKLIIDLNKIYENTIGEESIDYAIVIDAYAKINKDINELNKKNNELISHVLKIYDAKIEDDFLISGTFYNHEKKISAKLPLHLKNKYRDYISDLNGIICDFRLELLNYDYADHQDVFFENQRIIQKENIKFKKTTIEKKSIYLDANAVQLISSELKPTEKEKYSFVYSTYLFEDILNSNPISLSSFYSDLLSLTNGKMVGYMNEGLSYVTESIEHTTARVQKYSKLTKLFEFTIVSNFIKNFHAYPELRKGRELSNTISSDVIGFFKGNTKEKVSGFNYVKHKYSNTSIDKFIDAGSIGFVEDYQTVIEDLSSLFDFVNFETEHLKISNSNKIASSYRDRAHLEHAYICDYFVTEDTRLKNRAKIIYEILDIKTKVVGVNELKKILRQK